MKNLVKMNKAEKIESEKIKRWDIDLVDREEEERKCIKRERDFRL